MAAFNHLLIQSNPTTKRLFNRVVPLSNSPLIHSLVHSFIDSNLPVPSFALELAFAFACPDPFTLDISMRVSIINHCPEKMTMMMMMMMMACNASIAWNFPFAFVFVLMLIFEFALVFIHKRSIRGHGQLLNLVPNLLLRLRWCHCRYWSWYCCCLGW